MSTTPAPGIRGGPVPQGAYVPARRHGDMIFTSGMTPRLDGVLLFTGPVRVAAEPEDYREAVELACANALNAARLKLADGERIASILKLTVYIAAEQGFVAHSRIADLASLFLEREIGPEGIGCRTAVGVATLPGDAPLEIEMVATA